MRHYAIVVQFKAKKGQQEALQSFLEEIVPIALESPGCIRHDLHQSLDHAQEFLFYEKWESREAHERHIARPEVQQWRSKLDRFLEVPFHQSFWVPL